MGTWCILHFYTPGISRVRMDSASRPGPHHRHPHRPAPLRLPYPDISPRHLALLFTSPLFSVQEEPQISRSIQTLCITISSILILHPLSCSPSTDSLHSKMFII
ncbi:hypothetical protein K456DRAFT_62219 [Colletotrichum gloeosporioides 23]|nr:hypothetical protein K456DRAFT_62219 [Colletotrichum gloeosporioides 23]